jgi:hypothetical protein
MAVLRIVAIATLSTFILFSCTKEDFPPSPENTETSSVERTIPKQTRFDPVDIIPEAVIHSCGYGFYVDVEYMGASMSGSYPYEIRLAGTNIVVDSGMITDGGHTNWELSPCTEYDFEFWGSSTSTTYSKTQTARTDGCDGSFDC